MLALLGADTTGEMIERTRQESSPRRARLDRLRDAVRSGRYWVPAEVVAKAILRHFGVRRRRELATAPHQQR